MHIFLLYRNKSLTPLDSSKAKLDLGLSPRPLADTVRDTLDWFREHGYF